VNDASVNDASVSDASVTDASAPHDGAIVVIDADGDDAIEIGGHFRIGQGDIVAIDSTT